MRKIKYVLAGIIVVLVLFFMYMIAFKPPPVAEGQCTGECDYTVETVDQSDYYNSEEICGKDCFMTEVKEIYDVALLKAEVTCACCECVQAVEPSLGKCNYMMPMFDWMGAALGLCTL